MAETETYSDPGRYEPKQKRTGVKKRRYLIGLVARKILRVLRKPKFYADRMEWALGEMKKRKWSREQVEAFARGEWRVLTNNRGGRPSAREVLERQGMEMWKRRGLDE